MAFTATDYRNLQNELAVIEKATGFYLADENVDIENCEGQRDDYDRLYRAACMAAGQRAENEGADINALIGRAIY